MFETSSDDLPMFPYHDEGIDDLLFPGEQCPAGGVGGMSLAEALLPLVESPSPSLSPWMCSTRYKTELCSRYAETGFCKYAERCQFAHGLHDLHVHSRHPKYKTELCRSFHTAGYCIYGTRCLFAHTAKEQRPPHRRRRNIPCRTYRSFGVCPFGTRCNFLHIEGDCGGGLSDSGLESPDSAAEKAPIARPQLQSQDWKPRGALCRTFSSFGFCLYGTRCCFQHGLPSSVQGGTRTLPLSLASDMFSSPPCSSSSSPPSGLPSPIWPEDSSPLTTPLNEPMAPNAFTFSSQLNDVLLPLALRLQQLENSQAMDAACTMQGVWGNKL
ncbi:mRNA decay activator protein ZFP36L1-like isoform X2 [Coregonus clupeaformis]|uniref:mRNA decay activator protein ZFP36 n=1 Tax=Coregonus suidteri TaxID=861788 RepID=A0AAN8RDA5_9TELE|nr:mRNA decay activator protein ZFP36L1-like isoform X1 [Coregonus clupeaformis]XP_041738330.1 mRNA decay activator protein ZFP36L1-like isoform X2 [Coregonus clupeaformis]